MSGRLGKKQKAIVTAVREGHPLNRFFENGSAVYVIEGKGEVAKDSVERLVARGVLAENQDAMFGVGMSYRLIEEAV
jgi:hypothetical protein